MGLAQHLLWVLYMIERVMDGHERELSGAKRHVLGLSDERSSSHAVASLNESACRLRESQVVGGPAIDRIKRGDFPVEKMETSDAKRTNTDLEPVTIGELLRLDPVRCLQRGGDHVINA